MRAITGGRTSGNVSVIQLSGASGSGKSTILREMADFTGFSFERFDSLDYFNIPMIKKLLNEIIPD